MSTPIKHATSKHIVVCIDFGSSGSGFSILFVKDENTVYTLQRYTDAPSDYNKNLSCILYENGRKHSIGFTARKTMFSGDDDDSSDEEVEEASTSTAPSFSLHTPTDRVFIQDLKIKFMEATNAGLDVPELEISKTGRKKSLLDIMADYISSLYDEFIFDTLRKNDPSVRRTDVRWCVTVPASYNDHQKSLMRKVMCKAKIIDREECDENDLIIISEPDAATMFCMKHKAKTSGPLKNGETFMVVDAGGGTVDVSCHILKDGKLKEMAVQKAELCGSKYLDREFLKIVEENCEKFESYQEQYPISFFKFFSDWEDSKRNTKEVVKSSSFDTTIMFKTYAKPKASFFKASKSQLLLSTDHLQRIFTNQINKALNLIEEVYAEYQEEHSGDIDHLFVVGGLGDNAYFKKCIADKFESRFTSIVIPAFCSSAVLEGGAVLAKDPSYIRSRKSKLTYGVKVMEEFNEDYHHESKYKIVDGQHMAVDILDAFVEVREELDIDQEIVREYTCPQGKSTLDIELYSSIKKKQDVQYVDAPFVSKDVVISIPFKDTSITADRRVFVKFFFGRSELNITVENAQGEVKEVTRNFDTVSLALK